ncbi:MAG: hypothetical protein DHS20C01_37530 [marine bacterium B5-7]|nr:MAG: hypothetical protein DHS20C01_37530 [marine bacterium B5-7]
MDAAGNGGLGDVQTLRCLENTAIVGNRQGNAEIAHLDFFQEAFCKSAIPWQENQLLEEPLIRASSSKPHV